MWHSCWRELNVLSLATIRLTPIAESRQEPGRSTRTRRYPSNERLPRDQSTVIESFRMVGEKRESRACACFAARSISLTFFFLQLNDTCQRGRRGSFNNSDSCLHEIAGVVQLGSFVHYRPPSLSTVDHREPARSRRCIVRRYRLCCPLFPVRVVLEPKPLAISLSLERNSVCRIVICNCVFIMNCFQNFEFLFF